MKKSMTFTTDPTSRSVALRVERWHVAEGEIGQEPPIIHFSQEQSLSRIGVRHIEVVILAAEK